MLLVKTLLAALCVAPALVLAQTVIAPIDGRLKQIRDTRSIAIAYRTDAQPMSFEDAEKKPAGHTVDLCRAVVVSIERQIGFAPLQLKWVPVTLQTRMTAVASGQADMECGATTATLGWMREVDFSSQTFIDGTALRIRASIAGNSLSAMGGRKIGVIAGSRNERALGEALKSKMVNAEVVALRNRDEGLAQLEAGQIDGFASDLVLLMGMWGKQGPEGAGTARRPAVVRAVGDRAAARRLSAAAGGQHRSGAAVQEQRAAGDIQPLVRRTRTPEPDPGGHVRARSLPRVSRAAGGRWSG